MAFQYSGATKEEEERLLSQAAHRPSETGSTFVTGGDVSRFQRRTMPATHQDNVRRMASAYATPPMAPASRGPVRGGMGPVSPGPMVRVTRGKQTVETPVGER